MTTTDPRERMPLPEHDRTDGAVLEVEGLRTEFHLRQRTVRAVDGVSFHVRAGECVGLVGESGCGKSTTGLSIMKLLPSMGRVAAGSIRLLGRDLVPLGEHEMRSIRGDEVAMIFQDPMTSLNPAWTIGRQIAEAVRLHRDASRAQAFARALEVLDLVGMPRPKERLGQYPHQLSGGLRQRVMIAMALACTPKLLIADEPTTALDVTIQAQILDLIDDLRKQLKMAVVLITHDMGVIAARTDRVIMMYAGKIVEGATTTEIFAHMRHPYAEALLDSIPRLDRDRAEQLAAIPGMPPDLVEEITSCRFAPRCRYATETCTSAAPPLSASDGDDDHVVACFHPVADAGAPTRETPAPVSVREPAPSAGLPARPPRARPDLRPAVLELRDLVKEYPVSSGSPFRRTQGTVKAVSTVNLTVARGETLGLVGESGCGKTTIGRLAVALERPSAGSVHFDGDDLATLTGAALRKRRKDLQLMFQDPYASLDPRMNVRAIVAEPLVSQRIGDRGSRATRVAELLNEVGLPARVADHYPHEFSGGQRQRIGLARALALHPRLIVADEPVSALDVSIQAQILNLMRALQERHELTYVVISHDLGVVKYIADRIGVMYLGKLVELATGDVLYSHPAHPYTQGLIDAVPIPDPSLAARPRSHQVRGELPSAITPPSGCRYRTRCPLAKERCAAEEPPLRSFGPGHLAACHFPLERPDPA